MYIRSVRWREGYILPFLYFYVRGDAIPVHIASECYRIIKSFEGKEDVIFSSESSNSVIPGLYAYIDKELKYSKIKLGPKCDDIDFVAPYIKFVDRNIEVTKSQISYR